MDLRLTPEQEQLVAAVTGLLAKHSSAEQVRAAEPVGFDADLWARLLELGIVRMAVGEGAGGWGASMLDLALVAEQLGASAAPAPVIETIVAARLLERIGGELASTTLGSMTDGGRIVTVALHQPVDGLARLVPAAAVAGAAIVPAGDALLLVELDPAPQHVENLGSMPVADVEVSGAAGVLASGPSALAAHEAALDDWLLLTGSALVGVGQRGLEIGVEYVKERRAFGVAIGSFQAIGHRLADSAAALDAALLLTREAAWSHSDRSERYGELAASGFALAYEAARDATYRSLHFHGGYGFMMEYDIQLHYRRARAWASLFGGPSAAHRRIADKRYGAVGAAS